MRFWRFANPETNLFPLVRQRFAIAGELSPFALWSILKWKANRASGYHRERLVQLASERGLPEPHFSAATSAIAARIHRAENDRDRLAGLMVDWQFRLPTATAILTVLYPDIFTIYDKRACDALQAHWNVGHLGYGNLLWERYQGFVAAVRLAGEEAGLDGLRNADHQLRGRSWLEDTAQVLGLEMVADQDDPDV